MLASYLSQTLNLLTNPSGSLYNSQTLIANINTARSQIAAEYQCVRYLATSAPTIAAILTPVVAAGAITSVTVTSGGTGYASVPTIALSGGGGTAGALTAVVTGQVITSVTVTNAGSGYTSTPAVTLTGGGNEPGVVTVQGQEVYPFSLVTFANVLGYSQVLDVGTVTIIWGSQRVALVRKGWASYQATVRGYGNASYQDVPGIGAQYGQGVSGSLFMYPVPNAAYIMEWDCFCIPAPLATNADPEVIPYPWTDAVPYFAAYLAFNGAGRNADADRMWGLYDRFGKRARAFSQRSMTVNPYGR